MKFIASTAECRLGLARSYALLRSWAMLSSPWSACTSRFALWLQACTSCLTLTSWPSLRQAALGLRPDSCCCVSFDALQQAVVTAACQSLLGRTRWCTPSTSASRPRTSLNALSRTPATSARPCRRPLPWPRRPLLRRRRRSTTPGPARRGHPNKRRKPGP